MVKICENIHDCENYYLSFKVYQKSGVSPDLVRIL